MITSYSVSSVSVSLVEEREGGVIVVHFFACVMIYVLVTRENDKM
jgi:hypothetical protein